MHNTRTLHEIQCTICAYFDDHALHVSSIFFKTYDIFYFVQHTALRCNKEHLDKAHLVQTWVDRKLPLHFKADHTIVLLFWDGVLWKLTSQSERWSKSDQEDIHIKVGGHSPSRQEKAPKTRQKIIQKTQFKKTMPGRGSPVLHFARKHHKKKW